jgi:hypothetical protein
MSVGEPRILQSSPEDFAAKLRVATRPWKSAHIGNDFDPFGG